jgi:hypothetical protein
LTAAGINTFDIKLAGYYCTPFFAPFNPNAGQGHPSFDNMKYKEFMASYPGIQFPKTAVLDAVNKLNTNEKCKEFFAGKQGSAEDLLNFFNAGRVRYKDLGPETGHQNAAGEWIDGPLARVATCDDIYDLMYINTQKGLSTLRGPPIQLSVKR